MLGPHTGRDNALHLKSCLPVAAHENCGSVWELEGAHSSQVHFALQHKSCRHPLFTVRLLCTYRRGAGHSCLYLFILTICTFLSYS